MMTFRILFMLLLGVVPIFGQGTGTSVGGGGSNPINPALVSTNGLASTNYVNIVTAGMLTNNYNSPVIFRTNLTVGVFGIPFSSSPATNITMSPPAIIPGTAFTTNVSLTGVVRGAPIDLGVNILGANLMYQAFCTNNGLVTISIVNAQLVGNITPTAGEVVSVRAWNP